MDNLKNIITSPTLAINQLASKMKEEGREVYKFGFGQSPFSPPLRVTEALKNNVHQTAYTDIQGILELRKNICDFYKASCEIEFNVEDVLVAPGSKILLFSILSCFKEADVLLPQPSWVSYAPQVEIAGLNSIRINSTFADKWRITPENLKEALSKGVNDQQILIINYPGNPDGLSYTAEELKDLVVIFRKYNILVISDEIYSLLSFAIKHVPLSAIYPENTITTSGLSKWCSVGGWRLGVALLPKQIDRTFRKTLIGVASETYSSASAPIQEAAKVAYSNFEEIKPFLNQQNSILSEIATEVFERLTKVGVKLHKPEGAFYLFPDFSNFSRDLKKNGIHNSEMMCQKLMEETGVMLLPGTAFGFPEKDFLARLAFVDFDASPANFSLQTDCKHLLEGIDKLCNWLKSL